MCADVVMYGFVMEFKCLLKLLSGTKNVTPHKTAVHAACN